MARRINSTGRRPGWPDLCRQHPQQMQCVGMIGLLRQDLAIDRFRLGQSPGLMMRQARIRVAAEESFGRQL